MSKRGHGGGALTPKHCQDSVTGSISSKRHKTAIEQEIEEAEEYERRKETEQRRAQQLKLLSLDDNKASASTRNASRAASQQHADKCDSSYFVDHQTNSLGDHKLVRGSFLCFGGLSKLVIPNLGSCLKSPPKPLAPLSAVKRYTTRANILPRRPSKQILYPKHH